MMAFERYPATDCLALVENSPAAVAARDKQRWLELFARYALVEDPVGAAPHIIGIFDPRSGRRGNAALERFHETFIAPNTIRFLVDRDIVCGMHVVRDLSIEITLAPDVVVRVPMHLLYELTEEAGALRIFRLAAHWELRPMLRQQLAAGVAFLRPGLQAAARLLRYQGIAGTLGFMRALSSVGAPGKSRVSRFAQAFNARDTAACASLFADADARIAFPHGRHSLSIDACVRQGGELRFDKLLAAGNIVSATVDYHVEGKDLPGVAFFELHRRSLRIVASTFYWVES